jgi:hypothetical protein
MTKMKVIVYGREKQKSRIVGVANFDLGDFLNSRMTVFNSKEKLVRCEDKKANIGYQLTFEVRDCEEEKTNPRTENTIARK